MLLIYQPERISRPLSTLVGLLYLVGMGAAQVATFGQTGNFSGDSYLKYKKQFTLPAFACSLCLRFNLNLEQGSINWLLSYSVASNPDKLSLYLNHTSQTLNFCLSGSRGFENCFPVIYKPHLVRQRWLHTCMVLTGLDPDTKFAKVKMFVQGKLEKSAQFKTILDPAKDGEGMAILAQDQDSFGGGFDKKQSFNGRISQVNMFKRELTEEEISNISSCVANIEGDVISWSQGQWSVFGDVIVDPTDYKKLCEEPFEQELVAVPEPVTFNEAEFICDYLSGKIFSADDDLYEADVLYDKLKSIGDLKSSSCQLPHGEISFWFGNKLVKNFWTDYLSGEMIGKELQLFKVPSEEESCLTNEFGKLRPRNCDYKFCAFCEKLADPKPIVMKGFCRSVTEEDYIFDREYYPDGMRNGRIYFRGVRASHMFYQPGEGDSSDGRTGSWIIQSLRDEKYQIILPPKDSKYYPFGRFEWEIGPNASICQQSSGHLMSLTMSSCPVETFTCNTGECIPLANKCNSKIDCEDESDESQCAYLEIPTNYAGQLSPSSKGSEAVPVYVNISILALPRIDTAQLQFTADYYINIRWYDGRLVFKDLNSNSLLNGVQTSSLRQLWSPQLAFINALGPYQTVVDDLSVCSIVLEKNPTFNDLTQSLEYYGFDAYTNAINLEREYYQEFACEFDLYFYPFDTQVCHMVFALQGFTKEFIALQMDGIGVDYTGKKDLLEYQIQDWKIFFDNTGEMSQAEVKIVFRRNIEFHLFGVFLQQMILILVGFLTYFFDVDNFSDRVMVSLTLMLVIATISASIQSSLPATPYFKMIDIWLFFSMNLMVLSLIFHTYLEFVVMKEKTNCGKERPTPSPHNRQESGNARWAEDQPRPPSSSVLKESKVCPAGETQGLYAKRINRIGTLLYVMVVTMFSIVFWIVAFTEFMKPAAEYMDKDID